MVYGVERYNGVLLFLLTLLSRKTVIHNFVLPHDAGIVREVTDDKTLAKEERKRQQIEHAPHSSHKAKLVKLADKLYNLRDLNRCTPQGQLNSLDIVW